MPCQHQDLQYVWCIIFAVFISPLHLGSVRVTGVCVFLFVGPPERGQSPPSSATAGALGGLREVQALEVVVGVVLRAVERPAESRP